MSESVPYPSQENNFPSISEEQKQGIVQWWKKQFPQWDGTSVVILKSDIMGNSENPSPTTVSYQLAPQGFNVEGFSLVSEPGSLDGALEQLRLIAQSNTHSSKPWFHDSGLLLRVVE